jgi:hypothetical protein
MCLKEDQPCLELDSFNRRIPGYTHAAVLVEFSPLPSTELDPFKSLWSYYTHLHLNTDVGVQELILRTPHN